MAIHSMHYHAMLLCSDVGGAAGDWVVDTCQVQRRRARLSECVFEIPAPNLQTATDDSILRTHRVNSLASRPPQPWLIPNTYVSPACYYCVQLLTCAQNAEEAAGTLPPLLPLLPPPANPATTFRHDHHFPPEYEKVEDAGNRRWTGMHHRQTQQTHSA